MMSFIDINTQNNDRNSQQWNPVIQYLAIIDINIPFWMNNIFKKKLTPVYVAQHKCFISGRLWSTVEGTVYGQSEG